MIIGVTGNSGTGKTTICKIIEKNKIRGKTPLVLDADQIVKKCLQFQEVCTFT